MIEIVYESVFNGLVQIKYLYCFNGKSHEA